MQKLLQVFFTLGCALAAARLVAQSTAISPANAYLDKITEGQQQITEDFLSYTSAIAHGKTARKIEKRRKELITAVATARDRVRALPAFDGDTMVKSAAYNFYTVDYNLLNNDYAKIVDMEEIAEESYDKMEAYLMAQEKADEVESESYACWDSAFRNFAAKNNIRVLEDNSKLAKKTELVRQVNDYYHKVYLIFFKSYKQEIYVTEAIQKKDINAIEQSKNTLIKDVAECMEKLNKVPGFDGDAELSLVCRKALQFYQKESKVSLPVISDYLVKSNNFDKLKKVMDENSNHSKEDVDAYNKAVHDINAAVAVYNKTNKDDNQERAKVLDDWNGECQDFMNKHTPRYNK